MIHTMQGLIRRALTLFRRKHVLHNCTSQFKTLLACALVSSLRLALQSPQEGGILIYVPVHQASISSLGNFVSCMTSAKPVLRGQQLDKRIDLLIMTNDDRELDKEGAGAVKSAMRLLKRGLPQISKVRSIVLRSLI